MDRDAQHLAAHATVEALDHAVGLGRTGTGVAILGAQLGAGPGEGRSEAASIVGQHMGEAEGEGVGRLAQEGNGAGLGLVVLDREVHGAGSVLDGDEEVSLAPLAIAGLQLWQMLDVDMHEAEVVVAERPLSLGRSDGGLGLRFSPSARRMRQMLSRLRCGRKWRSTKVRSSRAKRVARRRAQTTARSSSLDFQGSRCGRAKRSRQSATPRLRHLRTVSVLTP